MTSLLAIDSETESLPFGDVQKLWGPEALLRLQPDLERAERWARQVGTLACQRLIDRFTGDRNRASPLKPIH